MNNRLLLWTGIALVAASLLLLGLSFFPGWTGRTDPAVIFLSTTAAFIFFLYSTPKDWWWKGWLYIPTLGFLTFGMVFAFTAITGDTGAWAYAWLLCVAGAACGLALAARACTSSRLLYNIGLWVASGSAVLFALFGAIVSGAFMRLFSILLLATIGTLLILAVRRKSNPLRWDLSTNASAPIEAEKQPEAGVMPLVEPLSKREQEVLEFIEAGLSNAEIAARLVVSPSTIKTHINNIYAKMGVQSRTQALKRARELHLLAGEPSHPQQGSGSHS
ncbi:MAG TPA: response regulator transcription factor [Anaerolineaceae bacterium]